MGILDQSLLIPTQRKKMSFIKNIFEKLTGLDKLKAQAKRATEDALKLAEDARLEAEAAMKVANEANQEVSKAKLAEELSKLGAKERATAKKEPYITVLETHVNDQNPRNGFFELDWNDYFVIQLKTAGYYGDTDEEIVDKWFQDLCRGIGSEDGISMDRRGSGYINVNNLGNGKSEIS
jgi:hypothetical protein